jgi:hypothetical protein
VMGQLLSRDWQEGWVMALLASAQIAVVVIVLRWYPETAHQELEALNPEDRLGRRPGGGVSPAAGP